MWTAPQWQRAEADYVKDRRLGLDLRITRLLDLAITCACVVVTWPVFVAIALAVRFTSPGPVIFRQKRLGRLGREFEALKFRTMVEGAIHQGAGVYAFRGDPRVTSIGAFLREYHLDELPQLLNVVRGEMSLVGPRPALMSALPTYDERERRRLLVAPGITGWGQVNGGALNDMDQRHSLDIWYVDNWNWRLDVKIMFRTVGVVLRKEGVYGADGWQIGRADPTVEKQHDRAISVGKR
jgi:lipopolysaccharide/colanic/teichoic acid biosynthesis glycosyltransferase